MDETAGPLDHTTAGPPARRATHGLKISLPSTEIPTERAIDDACQSDHFSTPAGQQDVDYEISGSASTVDVTYTSESGDTAQDADQDVPYSKELDVPTSAGVYLSAQNDGAPGTVTCTVSINGKQVTTNTSNGGYAVVTCSG